MGRRVRQLVVQSLRPILDERELAATPRHVAQLVRSDEQLSCRYRKAFGTPPSPTDDEAVFVGVGKALAAFQRPGERRTPSTGFATRSRGGTAFSRRLFRTGTARAQDFHRKGGCTTCHSGPNFTNGEFYYTGLSKLAPRGEPDPGRQAGIRRLMESRFNLLSPYNDDKTGASAARTREASLEKAKAHFGEFKVPSCAT